MSKKILNIGCGNDTYGSWFVDLYPSRPNVIKCNVDEEKLPFPENFFDEVYSRNLLEHLKNPGVVIKEMKRVLKKGGKLIIITDNAGYLFHHVDLSHFSNSKACHQEKTEYTMEKHPLDKHYSLFTPLHLKQHFKAVGLRNIHSEYTFDRSNTIKNNVLFYFCNFLFRTNAFKYIAYPRIKIVGIKK